MQSKQQYIKVLMILLMSCASVASMAQVELKEYGRYDSILVLSQGDTLDNPWAGGLNNPSISNMDINSDFHQDLVIFDKDHLAFRVFLSVEDTNGVRSWVHAPDYESRFPRMWSWAITADYNRDGKMDIFTAAEIGDIRLFENVSTGPNPEDVAFKQILFKDPYDSNKRVTYMTCRFKTGGNYIYTNVYNLASDIPGIYDVDSDGDLDILAFGSRATGLHFYKNMSIEYNNNPDSMLLRLHDLCWGEFEESAGYFELILDTCRGLLPPIANGGKQTGSSRHVGSNILMGDFNCDATVDVLLGDISYPRMVTGYNTGASPSTPFISYQDTTWPKTDIPVDVFTFPAAYSANVDHDSDNDILVTPNATAFFENFNQVLLYENVGTHRCPDYRFKKRDFLVDGMIEVGSNAHPLVIDVNGDSLQDILVGSFGVWTQSQTHESRLSYFQNMGTKTAPVYELVTRDYLTLPNGRDTGLYPTSGDLDNDGDLDIILGTDRGQLLYYENEAVNPGDSMVLKHKSTSFENMDFGKAIRPYLFDVNNDGLLDILMGSQKATIDLYINQGNARNPMFDTAIVVDNWGGVYHINAIGHGNLSVSIMDLDTGGTSLDSVTELSSQRHVFVGNSIGSMYHYTGMDMAGTAQLTVQDTVYLYTQNVSLASGDITGDDKPDFIFGQASGGMAVLLKDGGNIILPPPPKDTTSVVEYSDQERIMLFPNPTTGLVNIQIDGLDVEAIDAEVLDLSGRSVQTINLAETSQVDLSELPGGMYWIMVSYNNQKFYEQVVKIDR